ncbi:helix-turn-helix domain-containing protein [Actinacidiphila rubida]|uniref:Nitroimidazol reductase NimA, pyridoxamine 5'-phosphate oxidase superfamily n=1 Tax=Actinacidiphila rubida TaxID=310780 RepID=A0A1H8J521_9ACTN|nr:pyridoxamine 5'-phosphate oxidase family protein [Actinacidiphila rubida]SEN76033.1 Nitroimidazol reductase NimA, pyridoxamine 5'-phosphate oxidase superfamily [Actinacidiphila rubida]
MDDSTGTGEPPIDAGAVARRVEDHRAGRGLSPEALASQAGMSPRYLQHLMEEGPGFDPGGFLRIATALGLTYRQLVEGPEDAPADTGAAADPLALRRLGIAECWERIGSRGVGRIALPDQEGPSVFPVHYAVADRTVVYRTTPEGPAAVRPGTAVSFQVDHTDDRLRQGWSVLVTGPCGWVDDADEVRALDERHAVEPFAGGDRNRWVRIRPESVSGRRVGPA